MLTQNLYRNGGKVVNIPKLVNDIKQLNKYLMSISSKSSKKEIYGRVRNSAVSVRGNMDRRVLNLKKSMVDKGLNENKIDFE